MLAIIINIISIIIIKCVIYTRHKTSIIIKSKCSEIRFGFKSWIFHLLTL